MSAYVIPDSVLKQDFDFFTKAHADFMQGKIDADTFKPIRVHFGVYEQRERNTYMVRIKTNGGEVSATQLEALAELANRYANLQLHITTRGGVQLHYAKLEDLSEIVNEIHKIGLTSRGSGGACVRNINCDILSGIAKDCVFDVQPYVNALTSKMLELKDSFNLPKKYKIAFSSSNADRALACITDVGFIATIQNGQKGFIVYVAGGMGAKSRLGFKLFDFILDSEVFAVAQGVKQIFDKFGDRKKKSQARLRFVAEKLGEEKLKELILSEIKEVSNNLDCDLKIQDFYTSELKRIAQEPLPEMSKEQTLWWNRFVKEQKQEGYFYVKIPLKLGDFPAQSALKLAKELKKLDRNCIFFAPNQNLYLRNLRANELLSLYNLILEFSPQSAKPAILGDMVACTGAATCQLGIARPRGALLAIEKYLLEHNIDLDSLQDFRIQMSGCPNSCGNHITADLGFFGKAKSHEGHSYPAYNIVIGATLGESKTKFAKKIADISAYRLPEFVYQTLKSYSEKKAQYKDFQTYLDNGGEQEIELLAQSLAEIPSFEENKNPYFDYTSDKLFSDTYKERGIGEEHFKEK